jgi:DNA-binding NarL/FixJ family response regulator
MKSLTAWLNKMSLLNTAEQRVIRLASEGYTNRQIGELLSITEGTVKVEMSHAFKKLGLGGNKGSRYHMIIARQTAASNPVLQM